MKTLMTMLIALLLWTGSVYANGYDDALEVYLGYQDVYASLGAGTNYDKHSEINAKAYAGFRRFSIKYNNDVAMQPTIDSLKGYAALYYTYGKVWEDYVTSGRTDVKKVEDTWDRFPKLKAMRGNFWGRYDAKRVTEALQGYMKEYEVSTMKDIEKIKESN
jgi:hypothetical protein